MNDNLATPQQLFDTSLINAAKTGDLKYIIEHLTKDYIKSDIKGNLVPTMMYNAATHGQREVLQHFLNDLTLYFNVRNYSYKFLNAIFNGAVTKGQTAIVQDLLTVLTETNLLLKLGYDINHDETDNKSETESDIVISSVEVVSTKAKTPELNNQSYTCEVEPLEVVSSKLIPDILTSQVKGKALRIAAEKGYQDILSILKNNPLFLKGISGEDLDGCQVIEQMREKLYQKELAEEQAFKILHDECADLKPCVRKAIQRVFDSKFVGDLIRRPNAELTPKATRKKSTGLVEQLSVILADTLTTNERLNEHSAPKQSPSSPLSITPFYRCSSMDSPTGSNARKWSLPLSEVNLGSDNEDEPKYKKASDRAGLQ